MTLRDCCFLSLHTIKQNRARSILTIIIAAFLSFLIMGTMCLAISFSENGDNVVIQSYFKENSIVTINYSNYKNRAVAGDEVFSRKYYESLTNVFAKYNDIISYVVYSPNINTEMTFVDPSYPAYGGIDIIEGRNIQPSEKRNEVIVHKSLIDDGTYSLGNSYSKKISYYNDIEIEAKEVDLEFIVVGVFVYLEDTTVFVNGYESAFRYQNIISDIGIVFNINDTYIYVPNFVIYKYTQGKVTNPKRTFNRLQSLVNKINDVLPKVHIITRYRDTTTYVHEFNDGASCVVCQRYSENNLERFILILGAFIISIILALMSVGSLANSVMISIDTSKKFIGLLKAMGMKGKTLKLVVLLESMFLNFVGVLIGYLALFAASIPFTTLLKELLYSSYGDYIESTGYIAFVRFPIYVFFGIYLMFILFVFLLSRRSLKKIAQMEPIKVINEVS